MKLKGVLDFSLGNFLCLRGFARMGDLYDLSEADPSFQRDLLHLHEKEMVAFLREGEFLFFPEVILSTTLSPDADNTEAVTQLFQNVRRGQYFANLKFPDFRLSCSVSKTKSGKESRSYDIFQTATLELNAEVAHKFSRIDGNHRLSATPKDKKFESHNTPFCLLLFRNATEAARFSRALFHNINYRSVPLTMEQNLKLILDDPTNLFPDEKLKEHEFFGWPYYHARKLHGKLDFDLLPHIKPFIEEEPRTFLVRQFEFLIVRGVLSDNENAIKRYKEALGKVNSLFDASPALQESTNRGLLAAMVYHQLVEPAILPVFVRWVLANHLHQIEDSTANDLILIFEKVMASRRSTIFVSMPFGKDATENHFKTIARVAKEISDEYKLKPALKVERVDFLQSGTSFNIRAKIDEFMANCGLLIGDLTYCNPNVYHEIGFMDGMAKAEGVEAKVLLFLDQSVPDEKDKLVGFNLRGTKYIPFKQSEEFAKLLRENLERFYKLKL